MLPGPQAIQTAARHGIGALSFAFVDAEEAKRWVSLHHPFTAPEDWDLGGVCGVDDPRCGELASRASRLPVPSRVVLKPPSEFRLLGRALPRQDVPDKVRGSAVFGIDIQRPGMKYTSIVRAPVNGSGPETVDDAAAKAVPG